MTDEIKKMIAGFARFRSRYFEQPQPLFKQLAQSGQSPKVMVVACCDSRVDPAIITDSDPGDLFVVRNVANLVPPHETGGGYHGTSAALEFAVRILDVKHIIVLGHGHCGGIGALLDGLPADPSSGQFISSWMTIAAEARKRVMASLSGAARTVQERACEHAAIEMSLQNLRTFPWIHERVESGTLQLHGWYFDIDQGALLHYNPDSAQFEALH